MIIKGLSGLTLVALLIGLTGCSGFLPGLPDDYDVTADPGFGIVVGSVGTLPLGTQWREWSRYEYRSKKDAQIRGHVTSAVNWSNPFHPQPECPDDGLPAECGNLFAIRLSEGEYEFWMVTAAMDSFISQGWSGWSTPLQGYHFQVKSGQVTYVGNLLSRLCSGSGYSYYGIANIGIARIAQGGIADRYERDAVLIRRKFPQLQGAPIHNETMPGVNWRWEYKVSDQAQSIANWDAECAPVDGETDTPLP